MNINDYKKRFQNDYDNEDLIAAQQRSEERRKMNEEHDKRVEEQGLKFGLEDNDGW